MANREQKQLFSKDVGTFFPQVPLVTTSVIINFPALSFVLRATLTMTVATGKLEDATGFGKWFNILSVLPHKVNE